MTEHRLDKEMVVRAMNNIAKARSIITTHVEREERIYEKLRALEHQDVKNIKTSISAINDLDEHILVIETRLKAAFKDELNERYKKKDYTPAYRNKFTKLLDEQRREIKRIHAPLAELRKEIFEAESLFQGLAQTHINLYGHGGLIEELNKHLDTIARFIASYVVRPMTGPMESGMPSWTSICEAIIEATHKALHILYIVIHSIKREIAIEIKLRDMFDEILKDLHTVHEIEAIITKVFHEAIEASYGTPSTPKRRPKRKPEPRGGLTQNNFYGDAIIAPGGAVESNKQIR